MPRPEEEDLQLLVAIALAGGTISLPFDIEMRSYDRLEDLGWGQRTLELRTFGFRLTEAGMLEADKIARRRKLK